MARSICYCDPTVAVAGEINTWKFVFTPSTDLPKGTSLRFDINSMGREIDWKIPSVNPRARGNLIYLTSGKGKPQFPKAVEVQGRDTPVFDFQLATAVAAGEELMITMGTTQGGRLSPQTGNASQTIAQRRRPFYLFVDATGKGNYDEPEVFSLDIRGGPLSNIKILTPSYVERNKRFDVLVRFEDQFGNLTSQADPNTLIELSHEHLRENLNWKLFVPETGFLALPNLYFNETGVYTIRLTNTQTKEQFLSSPIQCFEANDTRLYWGLFHGDSDRFDSTENIESSLRHFRDDLGFGFFGVSPFESNKETPNDVWKNIAQSVAELNEDSRFVTYLGYQWRGSSGTEGLRNFVYLKDNKPLLRRKDPKYNTLRKIYQQSSPKELISIPAFTMGGELGFDFEKHNPEQEPVVEIYNAWGSSECTAKEGNRFPIKGKGRVGIKEWANGSVQSALERNIRVGFVAGGLDDRGSYRSLFDAGQTQYSPGLTAIQSKDQTRAGLMEALQRRSCYATTGARIIISYSIAGAPMGSMLSTAKKQGLALNRHIAATIAGTSLLKTVEIIRNGEVLETIKPDDYWIEFIYDDLTPLAKTVIKSNKKHPPFAYYYLRVTQADNEMAWSSPIWVDLE